MKGGSPVKILPIMALISAVLMVALLVTALVLVDMNENSTPLLVTLVGFVVTTVPSLLAAAFAERASRDIRNGVVVSKAREGAKLAIEEAQVLTRTGPVVTAELRALQELLRLNTNATQLNTLAQQQLHLDVATQQDDGDA